MVDQKKINQFSKPIFHLTIFLAFKTDLLRVQFVLEILADRKTLDQFFFFKFWSVFGLHFFAVFFLPLRGQEQRPILKFLVADQKIGRS